MPSTAASTSADTSSHAVVIHTSYPGARTSSARRTRDEAVARSRSLSGVDARRTASCATWWLVMISPSAETNEPVPPWPAGPTETSASERGAALARARAVDLRRGHAKTHCAERRLKRRGLGDRPRAEAARFEGRARALRGARAEIDFCGDGAGGGGDEVAAAVVLLPREPEASGARGEGEARPTPTQSASLAWRSHDGIELFVRSFTPRSTRRSFTAAHTGRRPRGRAEPRPARPRQSLARTVPDRRPCSRTVPAEALAARHATQGAPHATAASSHHVTDAYMAEMYRRLELAGVDTSDDAHRPSFVPEAGVPPSLHLGSRGSDADVVAPSSQWAAGCVDPAGRVATVSERNLFCLSVHGDSAVVGGADHGLHEIELRGGAAGAPLRRRRELYTRAHGHSEWVTDVAHLPDGRVVSAGMDSKLCVWNAAGASRCAVAARAHGVGLGGARLRRRRACGLSVVRQIAPRVALGGGGGGGTPLRRTARRCSSSSSRATCSRRPAAAPSSRGTSAAARAKDSPRSPRRTRGRARHRRRGTALADRTALCGCGTFARRRRRWRRRCTAPVPSKSLVHRRLAVGPLRPQRRCRRRRPRARAAQVARRAPPLCRPPRLCVLAEGDRDYCCSGGGDGMLLVHDLATGGVLYGLGANRAAVRAIHCEAGRLVAGATTAPSSRTISAPAWARRRRAPRSGRWPPRRRRRRRGRRKATVGGAAIR